MRQALTRLHSRLGLMLVLLSLIMEPSRSDGQRLSSLRVGVEPVVAFSSKSVRQTADSISDRPGSRLSHIMIGAVAGGLGGGIVGGVTAGHSKSTGTALDGIATTTSVFMGALLGALAGGTIGALIPHS